MSVPHLRLDDGEEAARGLLACLAVAEVSDPPSFEAAKELLCVRDMLIGQRRRVQLSERPRFTERADRVMARLAARRQSCP